MIILSLGARSLVAGVLAREDWMVFKDFPLFVRCPGPRGFDGFLKTLPYTIKGCMIRHAGFQPTMRGIIVAILHLGRGRGLNPRPSTLEAVL